MITDITIDDYLQFNTEGVLTQKKVTGISDRCEFIQTEETDTYYTNNIYKHIPFTPEIMEKNGFKFNEEESESLSNIGKTKVLAYDFPKKLGNRFFIEYHVKEKVAYLTDHTFIAIRYVDEFQRLLRLMRRKAPEVGKIADNFIV